MGAFKRELTRPDPRVPGAPAPARGPLIGMALGGGFARGLAHIGVLLVLEEEQIPIAQVTGTSAGAMIGAAYCSGVSPRELKKIAERVRFKDLARYTLSRYGLYSNDRMTSFLQRILKVKTFEELHTPLAVVATDLATGAATIFRKGNLIDPVRASCAYPGAFQPVMVEGRRMVDGLLSYSVPVQPLREMGAEKVIAVHFPSRGASRSAPRHLMEVIGQCFSIAQANARSLWESEVDLLIEPDVGSFSFNDFQHAPDLIRLGQEAARAALPVIRSWFPAKDQTPASTELASLSRSSLSPLSPIPSSSVSSTSTASASNASLERTRVLPPS